MADLAWAESLAKELIAEHCPGTEFGWTSAKTVHGHTEFRGWTSRDTSVTIRLSKAATQAFTEAEVEDTIRHEIAHVLAGIDEGHGYQWQKIAKGLGVDLDGGEARSLREELAPWVGTCPQGHESPFRFFRKPSKRYACSQCSRTWKPENVLTYTKTF